MRVGAIDIGTNTVRLLVADVVGDQLEDVVREANVTRLGEGVDATGELSPGAIDRTVAILSRYGETMAELGVGRRRAIATSASRDAGNVGVFLEAATVVGIRPEVIEGAEEAALSFSGAMSGRSPVPTLVIDAGGGSTEFVAGLTRPNYAGSVDIGSVRLTERMGPPPPASADAIAAARTLVADVLAAELELPPVEMVIGVAGTFTTLAAMHLGLAAYDRDAVHGTVLTLNDLRSLVELLAAMDVAEIQAIPSMDPARAPVILGGAIVAEQSLAIANHDELVISENDILDGVAWAVARAG